MSTASSTALSRDNAIAETQLNNHYVEGEQLGDQITELCGYLYAATYRLLVLIHEFDQQGYWKLPGLCSCAHWLNFKCGIGMNAAREKVRVAHALAELPKISAAFEKGELSYSKARAMTRIAHKDNEDYLLMIARHGTAFHVEKLVAKYSRAKRLQETDSANAAANEQHASRELNYFYDDDGAVVINARLPAEQGALIIKALEMAMDKQFHKDDVSAETSRRVGCDASIVILTEDKNGEPLSIGRRSRSIPPSIRRALRFRDGGCRFPGCTNTHFVDGHHIRHWADGGETSLDNLVQLCRHHHRLVHEGSFSCERTKSGKIEFQGPTGRDLQQSYTLHGRSRHDNIIDWIQFERPDSNIDAQTCVTQCYAGDTMDWDLAVGALFELRKK